MEHTRNVSTYLKHYGGFSILGQLQIIIHTLTTLTYPTLDHPAIWDFHI